MEVSSPRPSWVIEQTLQWEAFDCCGDQDPFPFRCDLCRRPLVLCTECEMFYRDLRDLSNRKRVPDGDMSCSGCDQRFDFGVLRAAKNRISYGDWREAGLNHLLVDRSISELSGWLADSAELLRDMLQRGMQSSAKCQLIDFRNLAESIEIYFSDAANYREQGRRWKEKMSGNDAALQCQKIDSAVGRAYAILGIADVMFPE